MGKGYFSFPLHDTGDVFMTPTFFNGEVYGGVCKLSYTVHDIEIAQRYATNAFGLVIHEFHRSLCGMYYGSGLTQAGVSRMLIPATLRVIELPGAPLYFP